MILTFLESTDESGSLLTKESAAAALPTACSVLTWAHCVVSTNYGVDDAGHACVGSA